MKLRDLSSPLILCLWLGALLASARADGHQAGPRLAAPHIERLPAVPLPEDEAFGKPLIFPSPPPLKTGDANARQTAAGEASPGEAGPNSVEAEQGAKAETSGDAPDAQSTDTDGSEETVEPRVFRWHELEYWFPPDVWEASIELGINGSEGNSNTLNTSIGANAKRETPTNILELDVIYTNNTSNSMETANQGLFTSRYDWHFDESAMSVFVNTSLEFDRFRAFDVRWAANGGVGYAWIRTQRTKLATRFGSGVSQEVGGPQNRYVAEATYGLNFDHRINKLQRLALKVDYFPDWQDYGDFRLNADLSWEITLSEPMNLSLKLGLLDRYDSTPEGAEANDLNYLLLLLWKL